MKNLILLFTVLLFSTITYAQSCCVDACAKKMESDFYFVSTYPKDKCVTIKGVKGDQIVAALYNEANKKRRTNNYHANIRNFSISGLVDKVNVIIIEGIHTYELNQARSTFNVFDNEKSKQERLNNLNENQQRGYSIHFRHASFLRSANDEVTQKIQTYLMGLLK